MIGTKIRESNFELLRIISMLMIVLLHANFLATGVPSKEKIALAPLESFAKLQLEALSIIAVNVFVLLSGWFGIRPKISRFFEIVFQVAFINILCVVVLCLWGDNISVEEAIRDIFMVDTAQWFVKTYLLLYLLSPVLNSFVEHTTKREYKTLIIVYLIFQSIYGWYFKTIEELIYGYSLAAFIILYLIGRYFRVHATTWRDGFSPQTCWGTYVLSTLLISILAASRMSIEGDMYAYTSPLVILASIAFVLAFSKMRLSSNAINLIARSCLVVYLLHMNKFVAPHFLGMLAALNSHYGFVEYWGYVFIFALGLFLIAIPLDMVRIQIWNILWKKIEKKWLISQ